MAKTKQRNAFRAGVFMIISIALVVAVVIAISGTSRFTQHFNNFVVRFSLGDDIGGLQVGDDVRLGGLKVGSIRKISVSSDDNSIPGVDVKIELPAEYTLRSDARILVQKGLTGAADINITSLGTGQTLLAGASLIGQPDQFAVLEANLELVKRGLVLYTFGNASGVDREQGLVVIKPSGVDYDDLKPEHMVVTDLHGNIVDDQHA